MTFHDSCDDYVRRKVLAGLVCNDIVIMTNDKITCGSTVYGKTL